MYAVTSIEPLIRTRATLRRAELGFFGVVVYTRVQTPRRCGQSVSAGALVFAFTSLRPSRTSWLIVGILSVLRARSDPDGEWARSRLWSSKGDPKDPRP